LTCIKAPPAPARQDRRSSKEAAMIPVSERKSQLEARLADLTRRLEGIERELDSHEARDWEDLATEREGDEVLESMGLSGQTEIRMIEAALERIAAGEYGFCMRCGDRIGEERLDVLPFTPFCRSCAADH
jgi:RNA polymerase-binding transcription factor DksA